MRNLLINYLLPAAIAGTLFVLFLLLLWPLRKRISSSIQKITLIIAMVLFLFPFSVIRFDFSDTASSTDQQDVNAAALGQQAEPFQNIPVAAQIYQIGEKTSEVLMQDMTKPSLLNGSFESENEVYKEQTAMNAAEIDVGAKVNVDWLAAGISAYLLGVILTIFVYVLRQISFRKKLNRTLEKPTVLASRLYSEICEEMRLIKKPELMQSDRIVSPIIVGIFRPKIILPDVESNDMQLRYAIIHELTHYKHKDLFLKFSAFFITVVHWFNPAAWLVKKGVLEVCEEHCDESVSEILSTEGRLHYAESMLHFAESGICSAIGFAVPSQKLKQRLQKMLRPAKKTTAKKSAAAVVVSLMLVASALVGCSFAAGSMLQGQQIDSTVFSPENKMSTEDLSVIDGYLWPLQDSTVVSNIFSDKHKAIDIVGDVGSAVCAANNGEVVEIGHRDDEYGNYIILSHEDGFDTIYGHNEEIHVTEGDTVKKGEHIASLGEDPETGMKFLHFEMWENGEKIDPTPKLLIIESWEDSDVLSGTKLSDLTDATLLWPIQDSTEISVDYGWRTLYGQPDLHEGIVIKAEEGSTVVAIADGTVLEAGTSKERGNYIKVDHGMNLVTTYANVARTVTTGEDVKSGQILGTVEKTFTGRKGDVDFYFELRLGEAALRPESITMSNQVQLDAAIPREFIREIFAAAIQAKEAGWSVENEPVGLLAWPTGHYHFISRGWTTTHKAIDIAGLLDTPIYAAEDGTVVTADWSTKGYGNHIIIDHGNGMQTLYAQMSELLVGVGDTVTRGESIGLMGSSGNSTGVHLHFEVRINGQKVPTEPYLGLDVPNETE